MSRKVTVPTTALSWARAARGAPAIRAVTGRRLHQWTPRKASAKLFSLRTSYHTPSLANTGPSAKSFCGTAGKTRPRASRGPPSTPRGARGFRSGAVRRPVAPGPHTPGRAAAVDSHSKTRPPHPGAGRRFRRFTRFRTPLRGDGQGLWAKLPSLQTSKLPFCVPPAGAGPKSAPIGGIGGFPRRRRLARKKKKAGGPAFPGKW